MLSIAFSLFLVTFLRTLVLEFSQSNPAPMAQRRAVIRRSSSLQEMLPESYGAKVAALPEVERVNCRNWFGGIYREPKNFFANFAVDHETFFDVYPETLLDAEGRRAFLTQRTAAICGARLAARFGWKVGERITLLGSIYPVDLELTLVGIYRNDHDEGSFLFRRDYLEEVTGRPGRVGIYTVVARSADLIPRLIDKVDGMFRNSEAETLTESERAFEAGFASMVGNVSGLILSVGGVVVFMILLVAGNTMSMNIRDRSHEIAVLKSLGFQNESLVGMLVVESVLISVSAGVLGCLGAWLLFSVVDFASLTPGFLLRFRVVPETILFGLGVSALVGLASGAVPAIHVTRLSVAEGLRRIA